MFTEQINKFIKETVISWKKYHLIIIAQKGSDYMPMNITINDLSPEELSMMNTLMMAWPQMTEMQKGKLLGYVEAKAEDRREERNRATA